MMQEIHLMPLQDELHFNRPIQERPHEVLLSLVLTSDLLVKEANKLFQPLGLTASQFDVLMLLEYQSDKGELTQTQLRHMLLVNRANITAIVDRMERAGWVTRGADPDRRVKRVCLTASGRDTLKRAKKIYFTRIQEVMIDFSETEQRKLCKTFEKIRARLR